MADTKLIGGVFGLDLHSSVRSSGCPLLSQPHLLLATARSAFTLLGESLNPEQVWLPSYLCDVVIEAFPAGRSHVRFYAVDESLRCQDEDWLRQIRPGDLAVFIDYFGFTLWERMGAEARRRGAWVVEDACHAFLNEKFCEASHYVIVSPRKFVGVPDGGILLTRPDGRELHRELPSAPVDWWLDALAASQLRAEFDRHGGDRKWFELFQTSELNAPLEPVRMSELTAMILTRRLDYVAIAERRRENYRFLAMELQELAMFPNLDPGIVPIGFPMGARNRDQMRAALFGAEIYPPVHWRIAGTVPEAFSGSHRLAATIMTLPCDQRYSVADMRRMVDCVKAARPEPVLSERT